MSGNTAAVMGSAQTATKAAARMGRPRGPVHAAVADALASGVVGGLDVLARHTGFPPACVRVAVNNMLRGGSVAPAGSVRRAGRGRPGALYAWAQRADAQAGGPSGAALLMAHVSSAWRAAPSDLCLPSSSSVFCGAPDGAFFTSQGV